MKLYEAVRSSASFRVRIALNLKGLPYESEVLDLRAGDHLRERYARINPMRAVPTLEDGEHRVAQSMAIVEYLEETHPEPPLFPRSPLEQRRLGVRLLEVFDDRHRLRDPVLAVLQRRDSPHRVDPRIALAQVVAGAQIEDLGLVRKSLQVQRDPHPERRGRAHGFVELHPTTDSGPKYPPSTEAR